MSCIQRAYLHYQPYVWFFPFSIPNSSRDTTRIFCQHEVKWFNSIQFIYHSVKCIPIRSFSGLCFPTFGLNTERYGVSLRIQSECWKIGTRNFPNTDIFHVEIRSISPYSVRMREITDHKFSKYGHFSRSISHCDINLLYIKYNYFYLFNPLNTSPTKWPNTLKQFVDNIRGNVWVFLPILWSWSLNS